MLENAFIKKLLTNKSKTLIVVVYALVTLIYFSGYHQKLYRSQDNRIRFHAIPIAISTLYQGHKHDYRGWRSTELPFQNESQTLTSHFLAKQIKAPVNEEAGHYYWVADDRGYADYVIASFALFGPHMKSMYHFWFVILVLSISLFIISFSKELWAMAFLGLVLIGLHSSISLLKLIHVQVPIYEPRYLDVLALIPAYHIIFAAVFFKKEDFKKKIAPLIGQIIIFTFLYHSRSSLGWEIVAIMGISLAVLLLTKQWNKISSPLLVIVLMLSSLMSLSVYKRLTYNEHYFQNEMGVRTFWHNALMGVNIKNHQYSIDDFGVAKWVIDYAKESNACPTCVAKLDPQGLLNSLGNWGTADWVSYEKCAKKLYFSILWNNKWDIAKMYLFDKPVHLLSELVSPKIRLFNGSKKSQTLENSMPWSPVHLFYMIPFATILFFSLNSLYTQRWKLLMITCGVFITGMIPSVAFYSDILTHGGLSATMPVFLYLITIIVSGSLYKWVRKNFYTPEASVCPKN